MNRGSRNPAALSEAQRARANEYLETRAKVGRVFVEAVERVRVAAKEWDDFYSGYALAAIGEKNNDPLLLREGNSVIHGLVDRPVCEDDQLGWTQPETERFNTLSLNLKEALDELKICGKNAQKADSRTRKLIESFYKQNAQGVLHLGGLVRLIRVFTGYPNSFLQY